MLPAETYILFAQVFFFWGGLVFFFGGVLYILHITYTFFVVCWLVGWLVGLGCQLSFLVPLQCNFTSAFRVVNLFFSLIIV